MKKSTAITISLLVWAFFIGFIWMMAGIYSSESNILNFSKDLKMSFGFGVASISALIYFVYRLLRAQ